MKCPIDNETLLISERNGIEIDYCPTCRGVWLDRGELDKIIDRVAAHTTGSQPNAIHSTDHRRDSQAHRKKKKDSFLGELFDF
jgi:uncharacterized protein